ncbi:MAG: dockerin type I domain-containing protein, partial [Deltaproteobacteria bacterium]|nr:dockerin type I domain-containing protein [Deltaproteobacteria bacterium]
KIQKKCAGVDLALAFPGLQNAAAESRTLHEQVAQVTADVVEVALIVADALDECGNGLIELLEACDDGGSVAGDGCSASCLVEDGFSCEGEPSVCVLDQDCPNGITEGTEQCDDGNDVECDGCSPLCQLEFCGDGVLCTNEVDTDGDGIPDETDNCPFVSNPDQEDDGGIDSSSPDGIGKACQCGDVDGDGSVTGTDGTVIRRCSQGLSPCAGGGPELLAEPENCDVNGDGSCNITDGTIVKRNVMGLTPCGDGVSHTDGLCNGPTMTEDQLCANAQPSAGGGGTLLNEECDDGNQLDEDGCSSQCLIEFCGDSIVQAAQGEDCDPPGSICSDGSGCQPDCNCAGAIGRIEVDLVATARCLGVDPNGIPYDPNDPNNRCQDFIVHSDCPPGGPQARCIVDSHAFLNTAIATPLITIPLIGDPNTPELSFAFDCGAIDPVTNMATCTCELLELMPVNLTGIGFVCFGTFPGCPAGTVDCGGGSPRNVDVTSNHNVGTAVVALSEDFFVPFCGLLDPTRGNAECAEMCDIYCESLEPQGEYITILSGCEGYCQAGGRKDLFCDLDADCPDGSCAGGDPVVHNNVCGCDCFREGGDQIARPGGINCQAGVQITVETFPPCDTTDVFIDLPTKCVPLSSERSIGTILNSNDFTGTQLPLGGDRIFSGTPANCDDLLNGIVSGIRMSGTANFFDSNLGDLQTEIAVVME